MEVVQGGGELRRRQRTINFKVAIKGVRQATVTKGVFIRILSDSNETPQVVNIWPQLGQKTMFPLKSYNNGVLF